VRKSLKTGKGEDGGLGGNKRKGVLRGGVEAVVQTSSREKKKEKVDPAGGKKKLAEKRRRLILSIGRTCGKSESFPRMEGD